MAFESCLTVCARLPAGQPHDLSNALSCFLNLPVNEIFPFLPFSFVHGV